jgi:hypothetical protein
MSSTAPDPIVPGQGPVATEGGGDAPVRGCMKWGLGGCAVLSVIAIVGMVLFMRKAPQLMETLLGATEAQVVSAIAPEVSAEEKEAFRREYAAFVVTAKEGRARPESIQRFQKGILEALKDGRVDEEELRGLTEQLRAMPKK